MKQKTQTVIVISKHQEKLTSIKQAIDSRTSIGKSVSYVKEWDEALKLVPKNSSKPYLLITSGIVGYSPLQKGEDLIKAALAKNTNGKSILVTSEDFSAADYLVKTKDAHDGGVEELIKVINTHFN